jgi:hypothetical protein
MNFRDLLELASFLVTIVGLPFAITVFLIEERRERENEEEAAYLLLSDAYNRFLQVVLDNADLQLRTKRGLPAMDEEQRERMRVIFEMLMSLFERAYLVAFKKAMTDTERRRWNSWDDYMREWCRSDEFFLALPMLLHGEDEAFQTHLRKLAEEERGRLPLAASAP